MIKAGKSFKCDKLTLVTAYEERELDIDGFIINNTIRTAPNIHDRFLIVDDTLYHIGASIKDLGKKLFAFSQIETSPATILDKRKNISIIILHPMREREKNQY